MRVGLIFLILVVLAGGAFLFLRSNHSVALDRFGALTASEPKIVEEKPKNTDIENQKPLANPPSVIKAIYATSWSVASQSKLDYLLNLIKTTELNAIVIDIKTFDGFVAYDIQNEQVEKYGAKEIRISKINTLIKRLHDEGVYAIARVAVFQDPALAKTRPELAVKNALTGDTWYDNKKLAWMDPASQEVWDYNIAIAKDAAARGFDEINFDYIRFPSDGKLKEMAFSFYNASTTLKQTVMRDFFRYLRSEMGSVIISADLFGLVTVNNDGLGIGQIIEHAYESFDYVAPMVYPSHYASGFLNYKNPAIYPYEVVKYSMENAKSKLDKFTAATASSTIKIGKLRPWLQDFDLGADYNAEMVAKEIQAVADSGLADGWMLWNPSNIYTKEALKPENL